MENTKCEGVSAEIKNGFVLYFSLIYDTKEKKNQDLYRAIFINCIDSNIINCMLEDTIIRLAKKTKVKLDGDFYKDVYKEVGKELNKFIKIKINKAILIQDLARLFNILWSDVELEVKYKVNKNGLNDIKIQSYNYNAKHDCIEREGIKLIDIVKKNIFTKSINDYFISLLENKKLKDEDFEKLQTVFNNVISKKVVIKKEGA